MSALAASTSPTSGTRHATLLLALRGDEPPSPHTARRVCERCEDGHAAELPRATLPGEAFLICTYDLT